MVFRRILVDSRDSVDVNVASIQIISRLKYRGGEDSILLTDKGFLPLIQLHAIH